MNFLERRINRLMKSICLRVFPGAFWEKVRIYHYNHRNHILRTSLDYLKERCNNRKLLIFGNGRDAISLSKALAKHQIHSEYFISDDITKHITHDVKLKSYVEVVFEAPGSFFILVVDKNERYGIVRQKLIGLGLCEDVDFTYYINIRPEVIPFQYIPYNYDVTLSYSRKRPGNRNIEGFELYGDVDNPLALKIVALGGSTTESTFRYSECWAQYLTKMMDIPVIMYCGGVSGYTSSQELLKLIRDVLPLQPDVVISYSGRNDLYYLNPFQSNFCPERISRPFLTEFQVSYIKELLLQYPREKRNVYYGLTNEKSTAEFWLDNVRIMRSIANEFNILFLSFFQPFFHNGSYAATNAQNIVFKRKGWKEGYPNGENATREQIEFMKNSSAEIKRKIQSSDYITDLSDVFYGCQEVVYQDSVHLTEAGNKIIAENIYRVLKKHLEGRIK